MRNYWLEWCQEEIRYYPSGVPLSEDKEDIRDIKSINIRDGRGGRVLRGGSFVKLSMLVRSACCNRNGPAYRNRIGIGFRPARTFRND